MLCKCAMYHFIFQVFAEQARKSKPDPKIFQQAAFCSKIPNLQPTECLHVGDTIDTDYVGAIGAGWLAKATYFSFEQNGPPGNSFGDFLCIFSWDSLLLRVHCEKSNQYY